MILSILVDSINILNQQPFMQCYDSRRKPTKASALKLSEKVKPQRSVRRTEEKPRSRSGASKQKLHNKENIPTSKGSQHEMKIILKQSYQFLKDQNKSLNSQLRRKHKKIEQLKDNVQAYETKLVCYEEAINILRQSKGEETVNESYETLNNSRRKFEEIIRQSQDIAKQSLEKYRKLEKQMEGQKQYYEDQLQKLRDEGKQTIFVQKVSQLTTDKKKTKSSHSSKKPPCSFCEGQLREYRQREQDWIRKEEEMKYMLGEISSRVNSFQLNCQASEDRAKVYKVQLQELRDKYEIKCSRTRESNQKLKMLFRDLMKETTCTKQEMEDVKKLLSKIIRKEAEKLQKR